MKKLESTASLSARRALNLRPRSRNSRNSFPTFLSPQILLVLDARIRSQLQQFCSRALAKWTPFVQNYNPSVFPLPLLTSLPLPSAPADDALHHLATASVPSTPSE
ncbi:hypothetical protein PIB30_023512 [Stylosanthes scabra]|uniref:Uncharacterized protein n=1 Tax=Stylosanthes scabra TaxID=79078 RepID=A0ABU6T982_9FABA|nr:hypothetical protein [Stylosanthes scabra]